MEGPHKEYSENDSFSKEKTSAEYGNTPHREQADYTGNETFSKAENQTFDSNSTTGSGLSEQERDSQDGSSSNTEDDDVPHRGNGYLVDKYNVNDKAHNDSGIDDFINTTSNFHHADPKDDDETDGPEIDGRH
jgi:hypothetical protein